MRDDEFKEFLQSIDESRDMRSYWKLKLWVKRIVYSPWFWFGIAIGGVLASIALR